MRMRKAKLFSVLCKRHRIGQNCYTVVSVRAQFPGLDLWIEMEMKDAVVSGHRLIEAKLTLKLDDRTDIAILRELRCYRRQKCLHHWGSSSTQLERESFQV